MNSPVRTLLLLGLAGLAACDSHPATAGSPARLDVVSGQDQQGTVGQELAQPLVVKVLDGDGNPVRGQIVNFVVTRGGGSVFAGAAQTSREGIAQERWTLGTVADSQRVEVRAVDPETGAALVLGTFRAVARAGAAAGITAVQAQRSGQPGAAVADSVAALVRDPHGNPVPGATVTWTVTGGGGSVSPAISTTNAQGVARARWTLGGNFSSQALQASAGAGMTTVFTATPTLGAGAALAILSGNNQAGAVATQLAAPLVVEVRQNGVPVQGVPVQWSTAQGTFGGVADGVSLTDAQGRASASWTLGMVTGARVAQAEVAGVGLVVGFDATATPGAPARVWLPNLDVGNARAGQVLNVRFAVMDAYNNLIPGATLHVAADSADLYGGGVFPATGQADASGWAYVEWTMPTQLRGRQSIAARLTATSPAVPQQPGYATARVGPGLEANLFLSLSPNPSPASQWLRWRADYTDAYGNVVSGIYSTCNTVVTAPPPAEVEGINLRSPGTVTVTATCSNRGLVDTEQLVIQ